MQEEKPHKIVRANNEPEAFLCFSLAVYTVLHRSETLLCKSKSTLTSTRLLDALIARLKRQNGEGFTFSVWHCSHDW